MKEPRVATPGLPFSIDCAGRPEHRAQTARVQESYPGGGLYDFGGRAIGKAAPFNEAIATRHPLVGHLLCTAETPLDRGAARIWLLPTSSTGRATRWIVGELVAALDHGLQVAILGQDIAAVDQAVQAVMEMTGGFDA